MKRWLAIGFISTYLSILGYGLGCHTLNYGVVQHPMMYFIVWDMFCGWAAYSSHLHVIAEGESSKFYELAPGPWGELKPYGFEGRRHYDAYNNHTGRIAMNTLRHTRHEPITRIIVIEESSSKKYELPDAIYEDRYNEPKKQRNYYRVRAEIAPDGTVLNRYTSWLANLQSKCIVDNPRLQADSKRERPMFLLDHSRDIDVPKTVTPASHRDQGWTPLNLLGGASIGN